MLFRTIATLLFTQAALAALTPDQVVTNIGIVTTVSGDLNSVLGGLTTSSGEGDVSTMAEVIPLYRVTKLLLTRYRVQKVETNFQTIVTNLAGDVTGMQPTPPFDDDGAGLVVDALRDVSGYRLIVHPN